MYNLIATSLIQDKALFTVVYISLWPVSYISPYCKAVVRSLNKYWEKKPNKLCLFLYSILFCSNNVNRTFLVSFCSISQDTKCVYDYTRIDRERTPWKRNNLPTCKLIVCCINGYYIRYFIVFLATKKLASRAQISTNLIVGDNLHIGAYNSWPIGMLLKRMVI